MTITTEQFAVIVERLRKLETDYTELKQAHDHLKTVFDRADASINKLFDAILTKQKDYRESLVRTMKAVVEHNRALFPERYVEGASPNLRLTLDPDKMV